MRTNDALVIKIENKLARAGKDAQEQGLTKKHENRKHNFKDIGIVTIYIEYTRACTGKKLVSSPKSAGKKSKV